MIFEKDLFFNHTTPLIFRIYLFLFNTISLKTHPRRLEKRFYHKNFAFKKCLNLHSKQLRIPSHIRVLHVEQEVAGDETSALESVLECDEERCNLLKREAELQLALEKDSKKTNDALGEELAKIYEAMQLAEVEKAPARASTILSGLGFSVERQSWPTKSFSGGWRMRLALARALFSRPDLLLLDEPTNMLDIKAIMWLEKYLQSWPTTLLVVSHDRNFLDTVS